MCGSHGSNASAGVRLCSRVPEVRAARGGDRRRASRCSPGARISGFLGKTVAVAAWPAIGMDALSELEASCRGPSPAANHRPRACGGRRHRTQGRREVMDPASVQPSRPTTIEPMRVVVDGRDLDIEAGSSSRAQVAGARPCPARRSLDGAAVGRSPVTTTATPSSASAADVTPSRLDTAVGPRSSTKPASTTPISEPDGRRRLLDRIAASKIRVRPARPGESTLGRGPHRVPPGLDADRRHKHPGSRRADEHRSGSRYVASATASATVRPASATGSISESSEPVPTAASTAPRRSSMRRTNRTSTLVRALT